MRLGNSGGKSKGKTYIKLTGKETITIENKLKADVFAEWFGENYQILRKELIQKDTLNEDILTDTYLRLYERVLYGGLIIENYKAYFHRAFFTNYMQDVIKKQNNETQETDVSDYADIIKEETSEIKNDSDFVSEKLLYIRNHYPIEDYLLFVIYLKLGTYKTVEHFTKLPNSIITQKLTNLRKSIKENQLTKQ